MDVAQFDFELPPERIALRPAAPRDGARLLIVHPDGRFEHALVRDLPTFLRAADVLVVNDTKVVRARLRGHRKGRGESEPKVEIMLHKRVAPDSFLAFARPARKLTASDLLILGTDLVARVKARGAGGEIELGFEKSGTALDLAIAAQGEMPLPPYIAGKRPADRLDDADYQTMFAAQEGSVAAPTAGLHFTPQLVAALQAKGISRESVTLHVGAGTFLSVSTDDTADHRMHSEWASLDVDTARRLNQVRADGGRIVAVGTTSLRTLESAADVDGTIHLLAGETDIFITPGYRFKTADVLLTNFHLPRSTLFMLVSAFCGLDRMQAAYAEAIRERYRFYSYGDACLLFRPAEAGHAAD
ncbi:MAG: tRNA preQ1(34) S-adenosylmethionine ribosyltransferase-isomerase QueA [Rhizomicrobium sp.]